MKFEHGELEFLVPEQQILIHESARMSMNTDSQWRFRLICLSVKYMCDGKEIMLTVRGKRHHII